MSDYDYEEGIMLVLMVLFVGTKDEVTVSLLGEGGVWCTEKGIVRGW